MLQRIFEQNYNRRTKPLPSSMPVEIMSWTTRFVFAKVFASIFGDIKVDNYMVCIYKSICLNIWRYYGGLLHCLPFLKINCFCQLSFAAGILPDDSQEAAGEGSLSLSSFFNISLEISPDCAHSISNSISILLPWIFGSFVSISPIVVWITVI